jgi:hypothetical protein
MTSLIKLMTIILSMHLTIGADDISANHRKLPAKFGGDSYCSRRYIFFVCGGTGALL